MQDRQETAKGCVTMSVWDKRSVLFIYTYQHVFHCEICQVRNVLVPSVLGYIFVVESPTFTLWFSLKSNLSICHAGPGPGGSSLNKVTLLPSPLLQLFWGDAKASPDQMGYLNCSLCSESFLFPSSRTPTLAISLFNWLLNNSFMKCWKYNLIQIYLYSSKSEHNYVKCEVTFHIKGASNPTVPTFNTLC